LHQGIRLWGCNTSTVADNTASYNHSGIYQVYSSSCTLTGNTAASNYWYGIYLGWGSNDNVVTGNTVVNTDRWGIEIHNNSNNNALISNVVSNNWTGIQIYHNANNNAVTGNTIASNSKYGIHLWNCSGNRLTANTISANVYGLYVWGANGNDIYNNNFIGNSAQAWDHPYDVNTYNLDEPIGGNYWNDWTGPDADGDGFVDNPYFFFGGQDNLPWVSQDGWIAAGVTWPGTNVVVQPVDQTTGQTPVTLTFDEVTEAGVTTVTSRTPGGGEGPPTGFMVGQPPTIFDMSTTAVFTGNVTVCIDYSGISFGNESNLKLFHQENGPWVDVTTFLDTDNDIICGMVTSLSPFAIFEEILNLDILPEDCPNLLTQNVDNKGRLPMAILGTDTFNVSEINLDSISIAGTVFPVKMPSIEDVGTPFEGELCDCHELEGDGINDLVIHFSRRDVLLALGLDAMEPGIVVPITVKGELLDGTPFEATDCVTIVSRED
jgi:parallel beta-helix repeat protein